MSKSKEYYIISVNHTRNDREGLVLTWWRENASGYTVFVEQAGRYPEEVVKANEDYYNNGEDTIAVPCERAEEIAYRCVPWNNGLLKQIGVQV